MNNDYGYNNKYSNKDPKKKRSGKFMEFAVKYNKIGWVLLIVLALYLGRGTLSRTINTFRNWEDIQEAKGDVILMQRLFNARTAITCASAAILRSNRKNSSLKTAMCSATLRSHT